MREPRTRDTDAASDEPNAKGHMPIQPFNRALFGAAEATEFGVAGCDLGKVLVARSGVGVCAILFGMNADELELDLAKIFPEEAVIHNKPAVTDDISTTLCLPSPPNAGFDFAVDIRGSFQRKVWNALRTISPSDRPGLATIRSRSQFLVNACNSGSLSNYRYDTQCKRSLINHRVAAA